MTKGDFIITDARVEWDCPPCGGHNITRIARAESREGISTIAVECSTCHQSLELESFLFPSMETLEPRPVQPIWRM